MKVEPLDIPGAWLFTPQQHADERGVFLEWYREETLAEATGRGLPLAQANHSVSRGGVVRGIHYADVPPSQGKYVSCPQGSVRDVIIDIRVGSPTFGRWTAVCLDDVDRRAVYVAEGLGHGVTAMSDTASLLYLCSTPYSPTTERAVHALDPQLGVDWGVDAPVMSPRDAQAPSLAEARDAGLLPLWEDCLAWYEGTGQRIAR